MPNTQKGQVYPPLMTVDFSDILITDPSTQTVTVNIQQVKEFISGVYTYCTVIE